MNPRTCPDCRAEVPDTAGTACPACGATLPPADGTPPIAVPVELPPVPAFEARPYQASNGGSGLGIGLMMLAGLVAAGLIGVLASVIGQVFYLIILFPIVIGLGVGFPMAFAGKLAKVHSVPVATLVGLWCGVVAMFVMHFTDFLLFAAGLPAGVDLSFLDFMDLQATAGVEIGRTGKGINLGYTGSVVYWLIEVGVVALIVAGLGVAQAESPFCVPCEQWKSAQVYGPFFADEAAAKAHVEAGRVGELARLPEADDTLKLTVAVCPECRSDQEIDVKLLKIKKTKDGVSASDVCHVTYPGEALRVIRATLGADAE